MAAEPPGRSTAPAVSWRPPPVPWRTIWATIAAVIITLVSLVLLYRLARVVAWMVVALFFTAVLTPVVDGLQRRTGLRRGLATTIVVLAVMAAFSGLLYAFIAPLVDQGQEFADDLPNLVEDAREGRGAIGELVDRYDLEDQVAENQDRIQEFVRNLGAPALDVARAIFNTLVAVITVLVLTILLLLGGPALGAGALGLVPDRHRERARVVATDCGRAVSGYIFGNVVISVIAGVSTWIVLAILGVPYAGVLALWVGVADLIPLVGATLGAIPTIGFAFLHSTTAGITTVIFYIAYQQFENHVLQVTIMSKTVKVNPLGVLVSVLIGVELFGILGALLAIPAAGIIHVAVRDLFDSRGGLKAEPTVGEDEIPVSEVNEGETDAAEVDDNPPTTLDQDDDGPPVVGTGIPVSDDGEERAPASEVK